MKKLGIYVIIFILVIMFRDNICFFYGNVLGVFKMNNTYYEGIIKLKDQKIKYLENEIYSKKVYVKSEVDFNNLNYLLIVGDLK